MKSSQVRSKLLSFLGKCCEKLGLDDESKRHYVECAKITSRVEEYSARKARKST